MTTAGPGQYNAGKRACVFAPARSAQKGEERAPMKLYHNIMEEIVEAELEDLRGTLDCCLCDQCRGDILAYALNQLPPRYVMTRIGHIMVKADNVHTQSLANVRAALTKGAMLVMQDPRH